MKRNAHVIYPKDIQLITGRSERYARKIIQAIKKELGRKKHQLITYDEFCEFSGLDFDAIQKYLQS